MFSHSKAFKIDDILDDQHLSTRPQMRTQNGNSSALELGRVVVPKHALNASALSRSELGMLLTVFFKYQEIVSGVVASQGNASRRKDGCTSAKIVAVDDVHDCWTDCATKMAFSSHVPKRTLMSCLYTLAVREI